MDGVDWPIRINDLNSLVLGSEFQVTIAHFVIEIQVLRFESSFIFPPLMITRPGSRQPDFRLDIQKECHIGPKWGTDKVRQFVNKLQWDSTAVPLVRHRRVIVAVANHHFIPVKRGFDLFLDVLTARRVEEQQLRRRSQVNRFGGQ